MTLVSVLIPARNEQFLNRTIEDVFARATGEIECLVWLDGEPPTEPIPERPGLRVIASPKTEGIGQASWALAQQATGDFIMKLDAHCALSPGYDETLKSHCGELDLVVPARYQLKVDSWSRGYGPIHYMYLSYPWIKTDQFGEGFREKKWHGTDGLQGGFFQPEKDRKNIRLDEIMSFQGSLWFMRRQRFLDLGGVDQRYWLWQESISIGMKVWLSGGRCLIDKECWYAHLHKGRRFGRGYFLSKHRVRQANIFSADYWMHDRWDSPLRIHDMRWFVDHFWPIPGWPSDWDDPHYQSDCENSHV